MLLLPEQIRSPHQPGKEQLKPSPGGRLGRDMPGLRTETQTEPFWQPQNGVRAGQGSLLGENSTAGPPQLDPKPHPAASSRHHSMMHTEILPLLPFRYQPPSKHKQPISEYSH